MLPTTVFKLGKKSAERRRWLATVQSATGSYDTMSVKKATRERDSHGEGPRIVLVVRSYDCLGCVQTPRKGTYSVT